MLPADFLINFPFQRQIILSFVICEIFTGVFLDEPLYLRVTLALVQIPFDPRIPHLREQIFPEQLGVVNQIQYQLVMHDFLLRHFGQAHTISPGVPSPDLFYEFAIAHHSVSAVNFQLFSDAGLDGDLSIFPLHQIDGE